VELIFKKLTLEMELSSSIDPLAFKLSFMFLFGIQLMCGSSNMVFNNYDDFFPSFPLARDIATKLSIFQQD
jgi:hypothetical protein